MIISSDWHIHSRNSCDEAALTVHDLVAEATAQGIRDCGLTDHIHTPFNLPDLENSRAEYESECPSERFHFGVEASCVSQWEIDEVAAGRATNPVYGIRTGGPANCPLAIGTTAADLTRLGVEYVVGGTHWPMYVPFEREAVIRDFHRQNMFLAAHPLVDIVAHPWWWHGHWKGTDGVFAAEPWFDDFGYIPESLHAEFAQTAIDNDTKVEINLFATLLNPSYPERFKQQYLEYLAGLAARGVALTIGSDCHGAHYNADLATAAAMLDSVGIGEKDLWILAPRSERHGTGKASPWVQA